METFKAIGLDVGSVLDPVRLEIADMCTGEIIETAGLVDGNEFVKYIPGFMTWIIRIYHGEWLAYEETPYSLAPSGFNDPLALLPTCRLSASRKGQKILVHQLWNHHRKSDKRQKKHLPGTVVIRMGGIGDIVMLSSALHNYKLQNPKEPLIFATVPKHEFILRGVPFVDEVINIPELQYKYYDKTIDLRWRAEPPQIGNGKTTWEDYTTKDRSDVFDELMGVYPSPKRFGINIDKSRLRKLKGVISSQVPEGHRVVGINAACHAPLRSLPAKYVKPICQEVLKHPNTSVVLFGQTEEFNKSLLNIHGDGIFNIIDKTDLPDMVVLISMLDRLITVDTGSLHVAGVLGIPTLALFGNINPRTRVSYYPTVTTLYPHGELPCIPCFDVVNPCMDLKVPGSKCMRRITPARVAEKLKGWV